MMIRIREYDKDDDDHHDGNSTRGRDDRYHPRHPLHLYLFLDNYHHRILCIAKEV